MEQKTLETLLVAQVLTLAAELERVDKLRTNATSFGANYDQLAVGLIQRKRADVLQLLAETKAD
jgi:hypothetical protein